jgi:hypothetical protein
MVALVEAIAFALTVTDRVHHHNGGQYFYGRHECCAHDESLTAVGD